MVGELCPNTTAVQYTMATNVFMLVELTQLRTR